MPRGDSVERAAERALAEGAEDRRHTELTRSKKTAADLRAQVKVLEKMLALSEDRLEALLELQREREPVSIVARKKSARNEATALLVASDWHVEEEVRPEQVSGLNRFDLAIAERRIERFWQSGARLVEMARSRCEVRGVVLALLGDFFSGHIHEDLVEVTSLSPTQSIVWLLDRLEGGIRFLLAELDLAELVVPCCIGNHGRSVARPRVSTAQAHSFEWLMYVVLAQRFRGEPRVRFAIAEGYHETLDVYGLRVRFHHGDWLAYQGGVGGLSIPLGKAIAAWNRASVADLDVLGHWHQLLFLSRAIVNSSLIGYGPFSVRVKAEFEPPQQAFALIDAEYRRVTVRAPLLLEGGARERRGEDEGRGRGRPGRPDRSRPKAA